MNDLVKKLVKESGIDIYGLGKDRAKWEFCLEKYTALIIHQCTIQCEAIAEMATITNDGEIARKTKATADSCANMIKLSFGVE